MSKPVSDDDCSAKTDEISHVTVVVLGKADVGKSMIIEELDRSWSNRSVPQSKEHDVEFVRLNIGSGEARSALIQRVEEAQQSRRGRVVFLGIIGAPDTGLEEESKLADTLHSYYEHSPFVWGLSRIDLINPIQEWAPDNYDFEQPESEKAKNIVRWTDYVRDTVGAGGDAFVRMSISDDESEASYGVTSLIDRLQRAVDEAAEIPASALENRRKGESKTGSPFGASNEPESESTTAGLGVDSEMKSRRARQIITGAATASAMTGLSSSLIVRGGGLLGGQAGMLVALSRLYDVPWRNIQALLGAVISPSAGLGLAELLRQLLPFDDRIAQGTGAGSVTIVLGETYLKYLKSSDSTRTKPESFGEGFREYFEEDR